MRFSIIIPAHNAEYFIGRAIDSILNQGFQDYEIIVVFDRCEDGTERVVQSYWADHPKQISWQYTNAGGVYITATITLQVTAVPAGASMRWTERMSISMFSSAIKWMPTTIRAITIIPWYSRFREKTVVPV